ncbi:MAG TPA: hypothetical protein PLP17_16925, partial [Oligoflexia bacterium]|nr:hypothetical protein [Oligoflexia bacterium]
MRLAAACRKPQAASLKEQVMDSSTPLRTLDEISRGFDEALQQLSFVDIHVHDMPDCCGPELALLGPDAVIDYHYLYGEVLGGLGLRPSQTDAIWA